MIRVKDEPDLARNPSNGVIQNTNADAYRAYIAKRDAEINNRIRLEALEKDNAEIKNQLSLIIELLKGK